MSEEKKSLSRRSFLKGATTAGVVAAVAGGGLFGQKLEAQRQEMKRRSVKEPPGVKVDKDLEPLANNLAEASVQGAYDAFNAAAEDFVKSKRMNMDTKDLLAKHGIMLKSPEARASARAFPTPPSVLKIRELKLKQKGFHSHTYGYSCGGCCYWHIHVTW